MRRFSYIALGLLLSLSVLILLASLYLQKQLNAAGVFAVKLEQVRLNWQQLTIANLQFHLAHSPFEQVSLQQVQLRWYWAKPFKPELQSLSIAHTEIEAQFKTSNSQDAMPASAIPHPSNWSLPQWFPKTILLPEIKLSLPCPAGQCYLNASAKIEYADNELTQLNLLVQHPLLPDAFRFDLQWYPAITSQHIAISLQYPELLALSVKQQLQHNGQAETNLALALSPIPAEFNAFLDTWQLSIPPLWREQFTQPVQFFARLNWLMPEQIDRHQPLSPLYTALDAALTIKAPSAFITPWGWISGEADILLSVANGQLHTWHAAAELEISHFLQPAQAQYFSSEIKPLTVRLTTSPTDEVNKLPLTIAIESTEPLRIVLNAELLMKLAPIPHFQLTQSAIQLAIPQLSLSENQTLNDINLALNLTGEWLPNSWQISSNQPWQLKTRLKSDIAQGDIKLAGQTTLSGQPDSEIHIVQVLEAELEQFQAPNLTQQRWETKLHIEGQPNALQFTGNLQNTFGLSLQTEGLLKDLSLLQLRWQLADVFLLAGNPLQQSLSTWPELLSLQRGRIAGQGTFSMIPDSWQLSGQLELRELAGLYDRSLFNGLSTQLSWQLTPEKIDLQVPSLRVQQLNHGIEFGPLQTRFNYVAPLDTLTAGQLELQEFQSLFLLGQLKILPQHLNLALPEQRLALVLEQLDLSELMRQHPTTDLYAKGKISGTIPVQWREQQLAVVDGFIAADSPGGILQYSNALAKENANPGLKLMFDALDDFHFSELTSAVSYNEQGRLNLTIALKGSNPAVQQGRPIHLNINLEEDLPAMIASIQLANKLNTTLTKRVQQYIQQRQAAQKAAGEQP